jgi:hypothetical protein
MLSELINDKYYVGRGRFYSEWMTVGPHEPTLTGKNKKPLN